MNTQHSFTIGGTGATLLVTTAVDVVCERIEQATINKNEQLVWIRVKDRLEEFLIEHNPNNFPAPVIPNRRITKILAAHQTIMDVTKNVLDSRVLISNNTVEVSAFGAAGMAYFESSISNSNELPYDEDAAFVELVAIFRVLPSDEEYNQWRGIRTQWLLDNAVDHDRALVILRKYPGLASQDLDFTEYFVSDNEPYIEQFGPRPLCCMLASPNPPSLAVVKEVYQMDPTVLLGTNQDEPGTTDDTALHYALDLEPCNEIVQFIFEQEPSALRTGYDFAVDCRPIDILLSSIEAGRANASTLSFLIELSPLWKERWYGERTLFEYAFTHYSAETMSFIAKRCFPNYQQPDRLELEREGNFDMPIIEVVGHVFHDLPNLQKFRFATSVPESTSAQAGDDISRWWSLAQYESHWSPGAAEKLLSILIGRNMKSISLHILPMNTLASCRLLNQLILTNTGLERLKLTIDGEESAANHPAVLKGIFGGLSANSSIRRFSLCGIPLSSSWQAMQLENRVLTSEELLLLAFIAPLLASNRVCTNEVLQAFWSFVGLFLTFAQALRFPQLGSGSLQSVTLGTTHLHEDFVPGMLASFWSLTNVSITFNPQKKRPYSLDCLRRILENLGNLECLSVILAYPTMQDFDDSDTLSICDALRMNATPFRTLKIRNCTWRNKPQGQKMLRKVLQGHNNTLVRLSVPHKELYDPRIGYYLLLNSFGRKAAGDQNTNPETFIELLCEGVDGSTTFSSIHYGLLRENPGLWSGWCLNL